MSIEKIPQDKIDSLTTELEAIGVHTNFPGPVQVPWFPTNEEDVNLLGQTLL